jgi:hypothetical protein
MFKMGNDRISEDRKLHFSGGQITIRRSKVTFLGDEFFSHFSGDRMLFSGDQKFQKHYVDF